MTSGFDAWFRSQCGERSRSASTDEDLRCAVAAGEAAASELARRRAWDKMQTAARYAWNLRQSDKKRYAERAPEQQA